MTRPYHKSDIKQHVVKNNTLKCQREIDRAQFM